MTTVGDLLQFSEGKLQDHYGVNTGSGIYYPWLILYCYLFDARWLWLFLLVFYMSVLLDLTKPFYIWRLHILLYVGFFGVWKIVSDAAHIDETAHVSINSPDPPNQYLDPVPGLDFQSAKKWSKLTCCPPKYTKGWWWARWIPFLFIYLLYRLGFLR